MRRICWNLIINSSPYWISCLINSSLGFFINAWKIPNTTPNNSPRTTAPFHFATFISYPVKFSQLIKHSDTYSYIYYQLQLCNCSYMWNVNYKNCKMVAHYQLFATISNSVLLKLVVGFSNRPLTEKLMSTISKTYGISILKVLKHGERSFMDIVKSIKGG